MKTALWILTAFVAATARAEEARANGDADDASVAKKLETIIPEVDFRDASLEEIVVYLGRELDAPIVFGEGVQDVLDDAQNVTVKLKNVPAKEVLGFVLRVRGLTYRVADGKVVIEVAEKEEG